MDPHFTDAPPAILMADDSRDDCRLVEMALKRLAFRCSLQTVSDGAALLDALRREYRPALILLDLNMPIMSGFEALKEIKAAPFWRSIPIVIWSTSHSRLDIQETYAMGTNAFMSKPDSFSGVVESMRSLIQFWFETSQLPQTLTDRPSQ
jgi:CheY-like chemotaxis protein